MRQSKMKFFSRGHLGTKFMCLEWPLNVLQELVPEDKIRLLDWLAMAVIAETILSLFWKIHADSQSSERIASLGTNY